jgi:ribosome-associated heat shock protein Hsp15
MASEDKHRIDRWLWAVRIFKTRSLAAEACKSGKVRLDDINAKPARSVSIGDEITVRKGMIRYKFKVLANLEKRVGAALVAEYLEDITPKDELDKLKIIKTLPANFRERGTGRPTKKDRREIDQMWDVGMGDMDVDED